MEEIELQLANESMETIECAEDLLTSYWASADLACLDSQIKEAAFIFTFQHLSTS